MRMIGAHLALLKAELAITGQQLGIIIGLALGALLLAILILILLYVGTFLFLGEWLFGSMGWGMIHGTLLGIAVIGFIAVNLAGGSMRSYAWGFAWGALVTVALSLLFASNLLRQGAVAGAVEVESTVPLHPNLLPTLVGLVVGGLVVALVALLAGWRSGWKYGSPGAVIVGGLALGGFVGAILGSTLFDNPGAVAISLMLGLLAWMIVGFALAARTGFDPETRYAGLIPRESIAAFERSRTFMEEQWERQKGKMMGR